MHVLFGEHKDLNYYQGLNFIGELFSLTYGKILGYVLLERFSTRYFVPYMRSEVEFEETVRKHLELCFLLLKQEVPNIFNILHIDQDNLVASLGFLISMILTWCASRIDNEEMVFRIFDFMVCTDSNKDMIAYLIASICIEMIRNYRLDGSQDVGIDLNIRYT